MKSFLLALTPLAGLVIACDSESVTPLCDPLQVTTGRVAAEIRPPLGRLARGQGVMYDNGAEFLFVDGQCNYWVSHRVWDETRSGELDVDAARRIGESLHFDAWRAVRGTWSDPRGGIYDAPVLVFDDAESAVICTELCNAPEVPTAVKAMRDEFPIVVQELWERGSSVTSSVRAIAIKAEQAPGFPFVDWPLSRPISDFVRTGEYIGFGEGTLEDEIASVQALKELRASFLRGDHGAFVWNTLPVKSDDAYFFLYLRDTLPFEDENGVVRLSVDLDSQ